jgi:soluble lytic murein transglycosylase-like protein
MNAMLEPILAQMQHTMVQTVLDRLMTLVDGVSGGMGVGSGGSLLARPSIFDDLIAEVAGRHDMDPALLKAVVQTESGFSQDAVSSKGAKGLMQLMDETASQLGVVDPFDPAQNIDGGARFLNQLLERYDGDVVSALAAYNAGPGAVDRWGGVPPYQETQNFTARVLNLREQYDEWMA